MKYLTTIFIFFILSSIITSAISDDSTIVVKENVEGENVVHVLSISEAFEYAIDLEKQELYLRAVPFYKGIIEVQPENLSAHTELGYVYYMSKEYNKAHGEFEWVLSREPNNYRINMLMGFLYQYQKQNSLIALKYYEQAAKYSEGDDKARALEYAGDIYQLVLYDWDKAIECYQQILKIQPNSVKTHFNLGACQANKGKFEDAIAEFKVVINTAQNSDHPELLKKALQAKDAIENAQKSQ